MTMGLKIKDRHKVKGVATRLEVKMEHHIIWIGLD